jgi:hypothetical protein
MSKKIIKMDFNTINQKLIDNEFNSSFEFEESIISIEDLKEEEENISERLKQISKSISIILKKIIEINSKKNDNLTNDIFNTISIPEISIYDYIIRIISYSNCDENILISSLVYFDKIGKIKKITYSNVYKILFTSILLSLKYNEDEIYNNEYYSQIAGVSKYELKQMEYEYFVLLNFNLHIEEELFELFKNALDNFKA